MLVQSDDDAAEWYHKPGVSLHEYTIHRRIYNILHELQKTETVPVMVPKVRSYDRERQCLTMSRIDGDNLSDIYGENFDDVPANLTRAVREAIRLLYSYRIVYPDVTGYNFVLSRSGHLYIVDFEHASYFPADRAEIDWYVQEFVEGEYADWNPDFR